MEPRTFNEVSVEYLDYQVARGMDSVTTRCNLTVLGRHFGQMKIAEIEERDIENFIAIRRAAKRAPGTINRQRATGSGLIQFAIRRGYRQEPNPFRQIPALRESDGRTPYYTESEMQRLINAASPHLKPILYAALMTMARRRELLTLRWADVNLAGGFIRFLQENTKAKRERVVPICEGLRAVLMTIGPGPDNALVFTWNGHPVRSVKTAFARARKIAGLPGLHLHDLRHVGSCWFLENGGTLEELRQILGHSTFALTLRYGRYSKGHMVGLAERLGPPKYTERHP